MQAADRRSTLCRKWITREGQRLACGFARDHDGDCSWALPYPPDGSPWRDTGPFEDVAQVMKQFARWSEGMPLSQTQSAMLAFLEGALLAGIVPTEFEKDYALAHGIDPVLAVILSSWLIRAAHGKPANAQPGSPDAVERDTPGH